MDMVELDCPRPDHVGFAMLKNWRDELAGRVDELIAALDALHQTDLARVLVPGNRVETVIPPLALPHPSHHPSDDVAVDGDDAATTATTTMSSRRHTFDSRSEIGTTRSINSTSLSSRDGSVGYGSGGCDGGGCLGGLSYGGGGRRSNHPGVPKLPVITS